MNDLVKFSIYYWNDLREWWRRRRNIQEQNGNQRQIKREDEERRVQIEMERVNADLLEEKLERVYFKLVQENAKNKRKKSPKQFKKSKWEILKHF